MKKKWCIVYNDKSTSKEYFQIVDFIFTTFQNENILCVKVPASKLKYDFNAQFSKIQFIPDCVLFWDKTWEIAEQIQSLGIKVYNNPVSAIICENKFETYKILNREGLIPRTILTTIQKDFQFQQLIAKQIKFPMVVKLETSTLGNNVFILKNMNMLNKFLKTKSENTKVVIQEYLAFSPQIEIKVFATQDKVLSSFKRITMQDGSYEYEICSLSNKDKEKVIRSCRTLGITFAGIDMLYQNKKRLLITDVNTQPNVLNIFRILKINVISEILNTYN
ncbi:MAG: ATP-grasp domain-containing protein [Clostridia bacterium]